MHCWEIWSIAYTWFACMKGLINHAMACKPLGNAYGESNETWCILCSCRRACASMCNHTIENGLKLKLSCSRIRVKLDHQCQVGEVCDCCGRLWAEADSKGLDHIKEIADFRGTHCAFLGSTLVSSQLLAILHERTHEHTGAHMREQTNAPVCAQSQTYMHTAT